MELWRFARPPGRHPRVYGHRGARAHAPENTMAAFVRAMDDGADGVEIDVRTSRDGVVMVAHDPDLERVTDARDARAVAELTARELAGVELPAGARIPTLAEVLEWADARDALVNVELKHDTSDPALLTRGVIRLLRGRTRVATRVILSSFDPAILARCMVLHRSTARAFLFHERQWFARTPVVAAIATVVGAVALHPERTLCSPARVSRWRGRVESPTLVNVWTVNEPGEAADLARLGVDGLITDDPRALREALRDPQALSPPRGARS